LRKRLEATVYGRVQGVNFRNFTRFTALSLGLSGEVQNLADGKVQVHAEGEEEDLREMVKKLEQGPPASRVEKVTARWSDSRGEYSGFRIVY